MAKPPNDLVMPIPNHIFRQVKAAPDAVVVIRDAKTGERLMFTPMTSIDRAERERAQEAATRRWAIPKGRFGW